MSKFPASVTDKYDVSPRLSAQQTIMPLRYGGQMMDLSVIDVRAIDIFCEKYPDNPYFKKKTDKVNQPSEPSATKK
ncbi:MAG TPA: hypothetical protein PLU58_06015 [Saprospiraceae bacterium]|jgi:hypothetical protein|nr:hypothetical protein [Saprospiraceae bacterium]